MSYSYLKIFRNPSLMYIGAKYITYAIIFLNSIYMAVYLGPYYLGIWGFINLIVGYAGQINMGIPNSLNLILSIKKDKKVLSQKVIGNSISMIILLSLSTCLFFLLVKYNIIRIGDADFQFNRYALKVACIAVLIHINTLLANIHRINGKIMIIAINQILFPIAALVLLRFFREGKLLDVLIWTTIIAYLISTITYIINLDIKIKPSWNFKLTRIIQRRGWYLFVYQSSLTLILLTTKSLISSNYSVKEFGYFTFSFSIANTVLILLNSISFLFLPKMLNRFAHYSTSQAAKATKEIRQSYILISHFLIHLLILFFPCFISLFPSYSGATTVFKVTALSIILYSNSFGYDGLIMAKSKEKLLSLISVLALIFSICIGYSLVILLRVNFNYIIINTLITYIIYTYTLGLYGHKLLKLDITIRSILNDMFPWQIMLPFFTSLTLVLLRAPNLYFIIPLLLYIITNYNKYHTIKSILIRVIKDSKLMNI